MRENECKESLADGRGFLVAPVASVEDARLVLEAGADEIYCGVLTEDWKARYGDGDLVSRRQGSGAHLSSLDELASVAAMARQRGRGAALTLNSRYTRGQERAVLELACNWDEVGGTAIIVADPGILLALQRRGSRLARHASLLTNAFNGSTARFLSDLGASRVILPRELSVVEVGRLINDVRLRGITLEYETIAINQRCPFIDGMCGFHHAVRLPSDAPAQFDYEPEQSSSPAVVWSHDPEYRGHGCQLSWQTEAGPVDLRRIEDADTPACAACLLRGLANVGVCYYKVAGRGYPGRMVARAVRFLRNALDQNNEHRIECLVRSRRIRDDYTRTFGRPCTPANCYYQQNPSAR